MRAFFARLGISAACYAAWRAGKWWGFLMYVIDWCARDELHCWRAYANRSRK
jgi:hypothetical protein